MYYAFLMLFYVAHNMHFQLYVVYSRTVYYGGRQQCCVISLSLRASPCASQNVQEVQPRPPTLLPRGEFM